MREAYIEELEGTELVSEAELQMSRLACNPNSCKQGNDECIQCSTTYCMTNSMLVAEHPEKYPSYLYVTDTEHCRVQAHTFGLNKLYEIVKEFDDKPDSPTHSVPVEMVIMEMGFTDSERLTKGLSADPESLVFVNPQPLYEAMMECYDKRKQQLSNTHCDEDLVVEMVKKVAYLMCRARKEDGYTNCVFKLWSDAAVAANIAEEAFADASIEYIYTDSGQYIGGAIFDPNRVIRAPCAKHKRNPSKLMIEAAAAEGTTPQEMNVEELCALEAKIGMEAVIKQKNKTGRMTFTYADDVTDGLDDFADRLHKTTGVGIPAHVRDHVLDVVDKDIHGKKDPDGYKKEKSKRDVKVGPKGKGALDKLMKKQQQQLEALNPKWKGKKPNNDKEKN